MRGLFTKAYLRAYDENIPAPAFLKSFFNVEVSEAKEIHVEVRRGTEKVAVDVVRGSDGNRNKFSLGTEKGFIPPYYNEYFEATDLDRYDRVFGQSAEMSPATIGYLASDIGFKLLQLRNKIERAKELQAAKVFETGVVTLKDSSTIDFKRKATSIVDNSGTPWSVTTTDIEAQIVAACEFIRKSGKNSSPVFNMVMPGAIYAYLKKTNYFKNNADYNQIRLIDVNMPQKASFGAAYHGQIAAGAYIINLWTYDEGYETDAGVWTPYMNSKKVFLVPTQGTRFTMAHAGIPAIMGTAGRDGRFIGRVAAEYYQWDYIDEKRTSHTFHTASAPLAIPVTVDMIYTMKVIT